MKTQHTPGPWQITAEGGAIVGNEGGTLIVETGLAYWQNLAASSAQAGTLACRHIPEVMANTRLIAAGPELLGACLSALRALEDNLQPGPMDEDAKTGLRAAIAKATGATSS